ncbi:MAG: hypothetical protein ACW98U_01715 [Candidatus Thorarchaeota archaeon]|jgi:hypothetical protein
MTKDDRLPDVEYTGICPFSEKKHELQINSDVARFILPREKKRKEYSTLYDAEWDEVVSFEVSEVHFAKGGETWPLDEDLPAKFNPTEAAGIVFLYMMPFGKAVFPIWTTIPIEDVPSVRSMMEERLERPSLPGLAHHGTSAAVKYILEHCEVYNRIRAEWNDWTRKGRTDKPNPKFREIPPDYVYCKEGMAIDFYGAGEQLEQMATFWPWRRIKRVFEDSNEFVVRYQWYEDAYVFNQQVLDNDSRHQFAQAAEEALDMYNSSDDIDEMLLIRPWSFPARYHRTWDKLEPFSSKASRNRFPPIYDFKEEY